MSHIEASNADDGRGSVADLGASGTPPVFGGLRGCEPRPGFGCASWTDRELVFAAREVRDVAFAELFLRHSASVAAVARMVLGGANSGTDDVVAEVFTALWCAPEKFDPDRGSLLGFLRMRARGRSIDLLRCESSRHRREQNDESARQPSPAIDAELVEVEFGQALRHAVSRLPEGERAAIELAYFAGMTYRAVATRLELPEGTVKSRIRSGLQRLRTGVDIDEYPALSILPAPTVSSTRRTGGYGVSE